MSVLGHSGARKENEIVKLKKELIKHMVKGGQVSFNHCFLHPFVTYPAALPEHARVYNKCTSRCAVVTTRGASTNF